MSNTRSPPAEPGAYLNGVTIGVTCAPAFLRLVRQEIRRFSAIGFIDVSRAHGIPLSRILWRHILWKQSLGEIAVSVARLWGIAILLEISLSYLFAIGAAQIGAEPYLSWAQMLMTSEARQAILFSGGRWLYIVPAVAILATVFGFYLFADGLRSFYNEPTFQKVKQQMGPWEILFCRMLERIPL